MKFIHLGDLHIGKSVNGFSMINDQKYILKEIIRIGRERNIDAVLIAGDVYDRSIPSEQAVELFDDFLTELSGLGWKVYMVSGNHDSDERLNFGSSLFQANNVYIAGKYDGKVQKYELPDEHGVVNIWLMPFVKASRVGHYFPDADTSTYDAAFRVVVESCDVDETQRNVMVAHQLVTGRTKDVELSGSESSYLNIGTLERITADCFDAFDYVALGHIHGPQKIEREECRYSGSPLKYSLKEIGKDKSVPVVTMGEKGKIDIELVPLKPLRNMRKITGPLEELVASAVDTEDYIHAVLTDESAQFDAMVRIRDVYPHTMKLEYDNSETRAMRDSDGVVVTEDKSFHELVQEFYKMMKGAEPTEEEWEVIEDVAREVGVLE